MHIVSTTCVSGWAFSLFYFWGDRPAQRDEEDARTHRAEPASTLVVRVAKGIYPNEA